MNDLRVSFNQLISDYKEVLDTFDQYKSDQVRRFLKLTELNIWVVDKQNRGCLFW